MDEEKLILAVKKRPSLFDKADLKYHNRDHSRKVWNDVAAEIGCKADAAKKKWASLRDYFLKQVRQEKHILSGASKKKKWPLLDSMYFLLPYTQSREMTESGGLETLKSTDSQDMCSIIKSEDEMCLSRPESTQSVCTPSPELPIPDHIFEPSVTPPAPNRPHKRKFIAPSDHFDMETLYKAKAPREQEDDDDIYFFKSLLPTIKAMRPIQKLKFRHEVHGLLLRFAETMEEENSQANILINQQRSSLTIQPSQQATDTSQYDTNEGACNFSSRS